MQDYRKFLNYRLIQLFFMFQNCRTFPVWSRILHTFAMLLMILNSSMNILFYGIFNAQFRKVARALVIRREIEEPKNHQKRHDQEIIELEAKEPVEV